MRRRWIVLVLVLLALVAGAAHVRYWYAPRERPAAPGAGEAATAVFAASPLPIRLWIPYPHQNLAQLRRRGPAGVMATLRLFGVELPRLPGFGPFDVPPASAVAVASDARGDRFLAVAQVYPSIAALARAAGRVAGNPWLKGGEVESGGRRLRIGWAEGNVWWVTTEDTADLNAALAAGGTAEGLPAGLAWLRARRDLGPLPAGDYRLAGPADAPRLIFRDAAGVETPVLDLGGDGSRLEIRLPAREGGD
jgi:hypothetical protein